MRLQNVSRTRVDARGLSETREDKKMRCEGVEATANKGKVVRYQLFTISDRPEFGSRRLHQDSQLP